MFTPFCWVIQLITMIGWKMFESMVVSPDPKNTQQQQRKQQQQPKHRIHMELKITVAEITELLTLTFVLLKFYLIVVIYYSIKEIGPSRRARLLSQVVCKPEKSMHAISTMVLSLSVTT